MSNQSAPDPIDRLRAVVPNLRAWVDATIAEHAARGIAPNTFHRLPAYLGSTFVNRARYVVVESLPMPPLTSWGLSEMEAFENMDADAVTYGSTYFVKPAAVGNEAIHLHELVHVVQWEFIGFDRFALTYGLGLGVCGYRDSMLEVIANDHAARFRDGCAPYDVPSAVMRQVRTLIIPP